MKVKAMAKSAQDSYDEALKEKERMMDADSKDMAAQLAKGEEDSAKFALAEKKDLQAQCQSMKEKAETRRDARMKSIQADEDNKRKEHDRKGAELKDTMEKFKAEMLARQTAIGEKKDPFDMEEAKLNARQHWDSVKKEEEKIVIDHLDSQWSIKKQAADTQMKDIKEFIQK